MPKTVLFEENLFALKDPAGRGRHMGTEHRCLVAYHMLRFKRPVISDTDVENAKVALKHSGWAIVPVTMTVTERAS